MTICIQGKSSGRTSSDHNPNTPDFFNNLYNGVWKTETGTTPYEYEEALRVEFYKRLAGLPFFNGSGRILDVGCGMGGVFRALPRDNRLKKYGIDFSSVAIEKVQERFPDGTFVTGDVHHLPYPDNIFDRVICTETLEHVDDPAEVVAEMFRVLKGNGKLLITVPEESLDLKPEAWPGGKSLHINKFSVATLVALCESKGFGIDSTEIDDNEIWLTASKVAASDRCRRARTQLALTSVYTDIETARTLFRDGKYPEAFDIYEAVAEAFPTLKIAVLAEAFDLYHQIEHLDRYTLYQSRFFDFGIKPEDKVLDVGSGNIPFLHATHLAVEDGSVGRAGEAFKYIDGKPVIECDVENMPFADKEFDFVYCSHVLEHANDPEKACRELMRVAKRGYIETPTRGKDLWLNSAGISNHRWGVEWINNTLIFTELTAEEIAGLQCDILMNMHCAPQTPREKAFSALIYLKAHLVNTMVYWEEGFRFEVRRLSDSSPAVMLTEAVSVDTPQQATGESPACLFVNTYYDAFLRDFYSRNPRMLSAPYREQLAALRAECFGDSDFYSSGLKAAGWNAEDVIVNCNPLQIAWAKENGFAGQGYEIALEQIRRVRPQVVYFQDLSIATEEFLAAIRPYTELVVGQIASPVPPSAHLRGFDIIISSFPHFVTRFREAGITSYYQPLAFEPRVLQKLPRADAKHPVTFVGGISTAHGKGLELLESLARATPIEFWGYGAAGLPPESAILPRHHGEAWGLTMFSLLASSKVTVNRHIDVAENNANNMRLFEATGCGALLITDYKDNLGDLFEIGKEVVAYRSPEECAALIEYYAAHPEEAEAIARAGQQRTLRDHAYGKRMAQTAEILSRHLRYRNEAQRLVAPDLSQISRGYAAINPGAVTEEHASAWKTASIAVQQRALVQSQLAEMYHGQVATPFRVLVDLLKPVVTPGSSILEIGCASGYYFEALEYLLSTSLDYTGADYSDAMISMAREYYSRGKFHVADGARLPFADRSFPVVVSGGVLLHVPDYARHIEETARVAAKHVAVHRTPVCRKRPTTFFTKSAYGVETVELRFNEEEIIGLFEKAGFRLKSQIRYVENAAQDEYEVSYLFSRMEEKAVIPSPAKPHQAPPPVQRPAKTGPVVLVSRPIAFTFPLSYAYLSGYLRSQGEEVKMLFRDVSVDVLVKNIMALNPLIVGFGNLYPELQEIKVLIRKLDEAGRKFPIVVGGQMVSPIPEFAVEVTGADFGVIGEGELVLYELVRRLREGEDPSDIPGLAVREGNRVRNNGPGDYILDLSQLPPIPYDLFPTSQWLPIGQWYAKHLPPPHWKIEDRVINVHGGRGCPFTCNFCYHHSKPRYRDIPVMMAEAQEALKRFNGNMLYFSDDLVIGTPKRARQLIEAIGNLDRPISYQVSTRFDILSKMDDSLLQDLKRTGCRSMGLGLESGSERILKIIGKNCGPDQIWQGLERLRQVSIYPTTSIMVGQHTETVDDVMESMSLMIRSVRANPFIEYAFTVTTPFPGSPLHAMIFQKGLLKDEREFYNRYFSAPGEWKQVVNMSGMADDEVFFLLQEMNRIYKEEKQKSREKLRFAS